MITTEEEYAFTPERAAEFAARLERRTTEAGKGSEDPAREVAVRSQLLELQRELAMWEAGIREPVPGGPLDAVPTITEEEYQALTEPDRATFRPRLTIAVRQAEIANIDRQIGIALDRIADWRRHRSWLEREISDPAAADREPAGSRI
jgi:hypothetical protein